MNKEIIKNHLEEIQKINNNIWKEIMMDISENKYLFGYICSFYDSLKDMIGNLLGEIDESNE